MQVQYCTVGRAVRYCTVVRCERGSLLYPPCLVGPYLVGRVAESLLCVRVAPRGGVPS